MFEAEQVDVMLCTRNMIRKLPNCEFHPVAEAVLYAVLPKDSPLAENRNCILPICRTSAS